jgi:hypothetical protein
MPNNYVRLMILESSINWVYVEKQAGEFGNLVRQAVIHSWVTLTISRSCMHWEYACPARICYLTRFGWAFRPTDGSPRVGVSLGI